MQFAGTAGPDQADQGLRCPLTELMGTVEYVDKKEES